MYQEKNCINFAKKAKNISEIDNSLILVIAGVFDLFSIDFA